jgi:hypothetical protein
VQLLELLVRHVLRVDEHVAGSLLGPDQLVELHLQCLRVAVLVVLEEKTVRKVTIVVEVLITSCHVLLKPKNGPVTAHATTRPSAAMKAQ